MNLYGHSWSIVLSNVRAMAWYILIYGLGFRSQARPTVKRIRMATSFVFNIINLSVY